MEIILLSFWLIPILLSYLKNTRDLRGIRKLSRPFFVKPVHGASRIDQATLLNVFNRTETFYLLENLPLFDDILGFNFIMGSIRVKTLCFTKRI